VPSDQNGLLIEQIKSANETQQRLAIQGHASKSSWLPVSSSDGVLALDEHSGILQYEPEELVITARSGTSLAEINAVLAKRQQQLSCEPPQLGAGDGTRGSGTLGGAVACGLSGPGRPWLGAVRDAVLGVELINGAGEYLKFGGQVMKNVAGYDVSRLQSGAWGALGVMSVISLRVQPTVAEECTVGASLSVDQSLSLCAQLGQRNLPITASYWQGGDFCLRLAGNQSGVAAACQALADRGLHQRQAEPQLWQQLKDHEHPFFQRPNSDSSSHRLWRVVTPLAATMPDFLTDPDKDALIMWGGGLRWMYHDDAAQVGEYSKAVGGWCWAIGESMPIAAMQRQIMSQLAKAFDPRGVFASPLGIAAVDA
jgi:glycolate oxidase FAD binding subunit